MAKFVGSKTVTGSSGCSGIYIDELTHPVQGKDIRTDEARNKLKDAIREFQKNWGTETVKFMPQIISQKVLSKIGHVQEGGKKRIPSKSDNPLEDKMQIYVENCAQLCWLMRIQFPPIHLEFNIKADFDGKIYSPYLNSGEKMFFPVWPAMFMHKDNGALLRKGVVECVKRK